MNFFERLKYLLLGNDKNKSPEISFVADGYNSNANTKSSLENFSFVADNYGAAQRNSRNFAIGFFGNGEPKENDWMVEGMADEMDKGWFSDRY
jgi:hypothetical protein